MFSGDYGDLTNVPSIPSEVTEDDIYNYTSSFITDGTGITIDDDDSGNTITISVTNEFTQAHETKLDGIADGAEVNVQSNWDEIDTNSDAFIQNKPILFSGDYGDLTSQPFIPGEDDIYEYTADFITDGTGITIDENDTSNTITISVTNEFTDAHETKLDGIEDSAQVNVQSDWDEVDNTSDAFILNKPSLFSGDYNDLINRPSIAGEITDEDVYGHNLNIIMEGTGIDLITNDSDSTITISVSNEFTVDEKTKLAGISDGAEVNVQSDWDENDLSSDAYIHNKPALFSGSYTDLTDRPALFSGDYNDLINMPSIPGEVTEDDIYDYNLDIITEGTGIDLVTNDSDNTITISVTNEFTQAHETKLDGIADGAEVNVQSDWDEVDTTSDAFIQNKPTIIDPVQSDWNETDTTDLSYIENKPTLFSGDYGDLTNTPSIPGEDDIYEYTADFITDGTGITIDENDTSNTITISVTNEFTDAHETKLDGIADGAEVNVQSDWNEVDISSDAFIQNKPTLFSGDYGDLSNRPTLFSGDYNDLINTPSIAGEITDEDVYGHNLNIIMEGTGIDLITNDSDNTITISVTNEFTQAHETKLDGIETGAEVNVQSDWTETDTNSDAFILHKPSLFSGDYGDLTNTPSIPDEDEIYDYTSSFITDGTGITIDDDDSGNTITISVTNEFTQAHETKLDGIETGAEVNVQSNWDEINTNSDAFIQNKPALFSGDYGDLTNTPSIPDEVTEDDIYDFNVAIITDGNGITIDDNDHE